MSCPHGTGRFLGHLTSETMRAVPGVSLAIGSVVFRR